MTFQMTNNFVNKTFWNIDFYDGIFNFNFLGLSVKLYFTLIFNFVLHFITIPAYIILRDAKVFQDKSILTSLKSSVPDFSHHI